MKSLPKVGALYQTAINYYLILGIDRRGITPRVTMYNLSSRRKSKIRWTSFVKEQGGRFVKQLIKIR